MTSMDTSSMSAKPKKVAASPSYAYLIKSAIIALKERGGSSRQAIKEFVDAKKDTNFNEKMFNRALNTGVKKGTLIHVKGDNRGSRYQLAIADPPYWYINTFGPHTRYEKRKPNNVYVGVRRNRFRSKSGFVEYSTSNMKGTIGNYTPVQIMNRTKDQNRQYPSKYNGITPAFGLDVSSISTVTHYLKKHVADYPTAEWTFFFIPDPTFLQIEQHVSGIEDGNLAIEFKQLLEDNNDPPSFIVRNASVAPKYQYYNTDEDPDITDNPGWPSTNPISQGEDLIVKAQNGFQITVSNTLKETLTTNQIYTDFPLTIKKRKYKPRKHSEKKHSAKTHSILKKGATKRKHSELKEGGAKSKEDNSIFYMYFLHLFFNIGDTELLQEDDRLLFYNIIQNIYSRNQLENLKQKLKKCPHEDIKTTAPWKKWIEEITPSTPKSHSRAISPMPVVVEPLRFKKQKTKSGGKKRRSYTRKYKKHKSRFI